MKTIWLTLFVFTITVFNCFGQKTVESKMGQHHYKFENYQIEIENQKISSNEITYTPGTQRFKTIITNALNDSINFAGHCIFIFWGCGTSCQQSAIIDTKTKRVIFGPSSATGYIYLANSRLLISNPETKNAPEYVKRKTELFIWKKNDLTLLKTINW